MKTYEVPIRRQETDGEFWYKNSLESSHLRLLWKWEDNIN